MDVIDLYLGATVVVAGVVVVSQIADARRTRRALKSDKFDVRKHPKPPPSP